VRKEEKWKKGEEEYVYNTVQRRIWELPYSIGRA
jgi:hypothetical protein